MLTLGMEGRKWEIFSSAVDLFSKRGYENVSMRDIAEANGMRSASLYNHFPSKESLVDQMYMFYEVNVRDSAPDLDTLMALVPQKTPIEMLHATMMYYSDELQLYMDKIYMIAIMQANWNPQAHELLWNINFEISKNYLTAILQKMMDLGKIEPLDIDVFLELYISFAFTAIFRNNQPNPIGLDVWKKGLDMIFSIVKEISGTGAQST